MNRALRAIDMGFRTCLLVLIFAPVVLMLLVGAGLWRYVFGPPETGYER